MNVHESVTRLCPASLCGPNQRAAAREHHGFRGLVYDTYALWRDFASPERQPDTITFSGGDVLGDRNSLRTGRRFVQSLQPTNKPELDLLHVLIPHEAWHYLPTGQDYGQGSAARGLVTYKWATDWTALLGRERHLLQVGATDRLLGQIVKKLKKIGAYDKTLFIVTADHGVAFTQGNPIRGVSEKNYPQIVWAPLFIKAPGQTNGVVEQQPVPHDRHRPDHRRPPGHQDALEGRRAQPPQAHAAEPAGQGLRVGVQPDEGRRPRAGCSAPRSAPKSSRFVRPPRWKRSSTWRPPAIA